jgi:alkyl sulfatase BDS1-like metallo-beta-lactamase superfamily hydrolase
MTSVTDQFKKKMANNTIQGRDLLMLLDVIQEISTTNDDLKDLLNDLKEEDEPIVINFQIDKLNGNLTIDKGVVSTIRELKPNPTVSVMTNESIAQAILKKQMSMVKGATEGKIKLTGNLTKAAGLLIMLNIVSDILGIS